jgi:hypothetical protein
MDAAKAGDDLDIGDTVVMEHAGRWEHSEAESHEDEAPTAIYVEHGSASATRNPSETGRGETGDAGAPFPEQADTDRS